MINSVDPDHGKAAGLNYLSFMYKRTFYRISFQYIELRFGKVARMLLTSVYLVNMVSLFIIITGPAHIALLSNYAILE